MINFFCESYVGFYIIILIFLKTCLLNLEPVVQNETVTFFITDEFKHTNEKLHKSNFLITGLKKAYFIPIYKSNRCIV